MNWLHGCELALFIPTRSRKNRGHSHARAGLRNCGGVDFPGQRGEGRARRATRWSTAISILGTHLGEVVRRHAYELFSRQDAKKVLDRVAEDNPKVVEDLVPKLLSLAVVQKVLQNLLRERVSIRDAASILEALGEAAPITKNTVLLTEYVRQAIRRQVIKPLA